MSLLKNILLLIQEEMEKKNMMNQSGAPETKDKENESIESYVAETLKNNPELTAIDALSLKIAELEQKINSQHRINELLTKNIFQFDKNLKTVNEDFAVLAGAVTQLFQVFNQLKIIKITTDENGEITPEDLLGPEETEKIEVAPEEEDDDFNLDDLENIVDWEAFKEKHKKKFQ